MYDDKRRRLVLKAAGAALVLAGCGRLGRDSNGPSVRPGGDDEGDVSPAEDLMREHGVLNRVLLIYEECARRLDGGEVFPIGALNRSADIVRRFIEDYHEKQEEESIFPRFEKANKLVDLVATLRRQHDAGRRLTENALRLSTVAALNSNAERRQLSMVLRNFVRMYRPHEAREDTQLFPALRHLVSQKELTKMGEQFEDREHQLFGSSGFESIVAQVETLEQELALFDLNQFTPVT